MNYEEKIHISIREAKKVFGEEAVYLSHQVKGLIVVNSDDVHTVGDQEQILRDLFDVYSSAGGDEINEMISDRFQDKGLNVPEFIR